MSPKYSFMYYCVLIINFIDSKKVDLIFVNFGRNIYHVPWIWELCACNWRLLICARCNFRLLFTSVRNMFDIFMHEVNNDCLMTFDWKFNYRMSNSFILSLIVFIFNIIPLYHLFKISLIVVFYCGA